MAATVAALAGVVAAPPAQAAPDTTPVRYTNGTYVAMGDSRASGGFFTPTPDYFLGCKRSAANYPAIVALLALPRHFVDTSCAGAQAPNLYTAGQRTNAGYKPPQVRMVPRDAQVVSVSIGGNDMRWGALVGKCTTAPLTDRFCRTRLNGEARWRIARMENRVTPALRAIRRQAPRAQIIVVGIGGFMGNHGCWPMVPISDPDVRWMNQVFNRAGDALRRAATKVDGTFVDANRLSAGHDPCNVISPWYESALSNRIAYPYHINQAGAIAVAAMVNGAIRR
ncbi:SGNH/GDSL hydrolase family protein [Gordonia hankookensis]|uniref:SGNH/GDSL hydrolase family protein n=1 Tax=Gordonia hankookensis TaxID=589403 RepID=A0ABR7WH49_9ACTN|nr:SGNH/GDSL hydrolase family protein [Gordonia hankookensis]MBD1321212.1 SGNH/GDSL hydrolase family protein [Gordonia hankookensis]